MKKTAWAIAIVGSFYLIFSIEAHSNPKALPVFGSFILGAALLIAMLLSIFKGLLRWRTASRFWFVPTLLCGLVLGSTYFTAPLGTAISDATFRKQLAHFALVVEAFKAKKLSCSTPCNTQLETIVADNMPSQIGQVRGAYCDDGGVLLLFLDKTNVPLLHVGYLFREYGDRSNCNAGMMRPEQRFPYIRHIAGSWYRFSDQPGL